MKTFLALAIILLVSLPVHAGKQAPSLSKSAPSQAATVQRGVASWYGGRWIGRHTANGETYRRADMTAAHKSLPFGTRVRVIDERTGRSTIVRINNRGPFIKGRIIDLSDAAATDLGIKKRGIARVRMEVLPKVDPAVTAVASTAPLDKQRGLFAGWFQPASN